MKKPPRCRDCRREVVYVVTGTKLYDDGTYGPRRTAFDLDPVPTATCRVLAVVNSTRRGLVDVSTVHQPPAECFPVHRCPQYLERIVLDELDQLAARDDVLALMDRRPMTPTPPPPPQRVRRSA